MTIEQILTDRNIAVGILEQIAVLEKYVKERELKAATLSFEAGANAQGISHGYEDYCVMRTDHLKQYK